MGSEAYDLLYGGGYSIKDYYMESGNPRQMRGASELLKECAEDVERLLLNAGTEKAQIIISGATLSAQVPQGSGKTLAITAEKIFRDKCQTANAAFVAVPMDGNYILTKKRALAEYERRKAAKFTTLDFMNAADDNLGYRRLKPKDFIE